MDTHRSPHVTNCTVNATALHYTVGGSMAAHYAAHAACACCFAISLQYPGVRGVASHLHLPAVLPSGSLCTGGPTSYGLTGRLDICGPEPFAIWLRPPPEQPYHRTPPGGVLGCLLRVPPLHLITKTSQGPNMHCVPEVGQPFSLQMHGTPMRAQLQCIPLKQLPSQRLRER